MREGGFVTDLVADGAEGEYRGATESYDVAILDLGLPGLPGIEVLTRWRAQGVGMPVLILTARDALSQRVEGLRLGADVPFCVVGGQARVRGIGELVQPVASLAQTFTLVVPPLSVSTSVAP